MQVGDKVTLKEGAISSCGYVVKWAQQNRTVMQIEGDSIKLEGDINWFCKNDVLIENEPQKDEHYNNENGSLYLFAQHHNLNAWEFDILKRVVRCRKKGQFKEDLEKTKRVIDLYLKEFEA